MVGFPGMEWPAGSCTTHKESFISRWDHEREKGVPFRGNEEHFQPMVEELIKRCETGTTMEKGKIGLLKMGKLENQMKIFSTRMLK